MVETSDILFERAGALARVTLNRPKALNALTLEMARAFDERLAGWAGDDRVAAVLIRGAPAPDGRVPFCAGGDIRALYDGRSDPAKDFARAFYWHEYRLNRRIFHYPKPYIALIDGVVMGGGVGVSVHGSHRVVGEGVVFAMPETGIGLFPDVGGTYFLPRRPGWTGIYLALTGARLKAADALYVGVGSHHVPSARLPEFEAALAEVKPEGDSREAVDRIVGRFAQDPGAPPLAALREQIDRCFSRPSVEAILEALEAEGGDWAQGCIEALSTKSPTSLKVTFRQMTEGADLEFDEAMRLEYRLACRFSQAQDFYEGVRAVIMDKDNAPRWKPGRLEDVGEEDVAAYFASPPEGDLVFD